MAGKNEKRKRENAVQRFIRETMGELHRVTWPTWPEARKLTVVVLIVMVVMAIFLWLIDLGATQLLTKFLGS